jgi:hypothetical protein
MSKFRGRRGRRKVGDAFEVKKNACTVFFFQG